MDTRNLILEITDKNEVIRINRGRKTVVALLSPETKTLTWKDADVQAAYRKSMDSFLAAEGIKIETILLEGQKADVVPAGAPAEPKQHKMQGEMSPDWLEWLMKWKPVAFQNLLGVKIRKLEEGEKPPADLRELWVRANVKRTDTRAVPESQGGQILATKFKMTNQIIARRASHLTFTEKEIDRGDTAADQAEPYKDPHHPEQLHKMAARGTNGTEIVDVKNAAASAGSSF